MKIRKFRYYMNVDSTTITLAIVMPLLIIIAIGYMIWQVLIEDWINIIFSIIPLIICFLTIPYRIYPVIPFYFREKKIVKLKEEKDTENIKKYVIKDSKLTAIATKSLIEIDTNEAKQVIVNLIENCDNIRMIYNIADIIEEEKKEILPLLFERIKTVGEKHIRYRLIYALDRLADNLEKYSTIHNILEIIKLDDICEIQEIFVSFLKLYTENLDESIPILRNIIFGKKCEFVIYDAIVLLSKIKSREAVTILIDLLKTTEDTEIRHAISYSLQEFNETAIDAIPYLIYLLNNDDDYVVRYNSAIALGKIGKKTHEIIQSLKIAMLNDENVGVRGYSVEAIGMLNAREMVADVTKVLKDDKDISVKSSAAWVLGKFNTKQAIPDIKSALESAYMPDDKFDLAFSLLKLEGSSKIGEDIIKKMLEEGVLDYGKILSFEKYLKETNRPIRIEQINTRLKEIGVTLKESDDKNEEIIRSITWEIIDDMISHLGKERFAYSDFEKIIRKASEEIWLDERIMDYQRSEGRKTVFISYSWGKEQHENWVKNLAKKLVEEGGVIVHLDKWKLRTGDYKAHYINKIASVDYVIVILTNDYVKKAMKTAGGVKREITIIETLIDDGYDPRRIIPILREEISEESIPPYIRGKIWINMIEDRKFDEQFRKLLRDIYNQPKDREPLLGEIPNFTDD